VKASDIFIGPLLRRAQPDLVVICLATRTPLSLRFSVKVNGSPDWLGHDSFAVNIQVSPQLYFYFGRVKPDKGNFPTNTLLAYGIGVVDPVSEVAEYAAFESIVKEDSLAYGDLTLPTFHLQAATRKLNALYGSCRKIHDTGGGKLDALAYADTLIESHATDLAERPAILCLGGDQIYADDVDNAVMSQVVALAKALEVDQPEKLPIAVALPAPGNRHDFVSKYAKFTSGKDYSANHLVTFAEYLAIYGLMWNKRNWVSPPSVLNHFLDTLPKVRRCLANVATYMIFDDHDVTDDWNLSLKWRQDVKSYKLGKRIVANALMAFWLCQGYGNDPDLYADDDAFGIADNIRDRHKRYELVEQVFWGLDRWEFFTPTYPFVYFLDTRTQRGLKDGPSGTDQGAPAYLKSLPAWTATYKRLQRLLKRQDKNLPLVLMAAAPVFGFKFIEDLQATVSAAAGPYFLDFESWSANRRHLMLFLQLMGDLNVVVLSGDVHYAFTSTVKFIVFDDKTLRAAVKMMPTGTSLPATPVGATPTYKPMWTSHYLQLTSSALKNFAHTVFTQTPANLTTMEPAAIITEDNDVELGKFENNEFVIEKSIPLSSVKIKVKKTGAELKPARLFRQRINDAHNSRYVADHNLGVVTFQDKAVTNYYFTAGGKQSTRSWDFSNSKLWE
jgi:hypothetical protein